MFCYSAGASKTPVTEKPTTPVIPHPAPQIVHPSPPRQPSPPQNVPQPEPPRQEPQPGPSRQGKRKQTEEPAKNPAQTKKPKTWYNDNPETIEIDGNEVLVIRAEKIPGQRKITTKMTNEEKLHIAETNEHTRQAAVAQAEKETGKRIMLTGKFLNLGIPDGGYYQSDREDHKQAILKTATPKPTAAQPTNTQTQIEQPSTSIENTIIIPEAPQIEKPPETIKTKKNVTTLNIVCEGTRVIIYLYEDEQQLRDQFKRKSKFTIQVKQQPDEELITISVKNGRSNLWPTINFKLRHLTQEERGEIYYLVLGEIQLLYPE